MGGAAAAPGRSSPPTENRRARAPPRPPCSAKGARYGPREVETRQQRSTSTAWGKCNVRKEVPRVEAVAVKYTYQWWRRRHGCRRHSEKRPAARAVPFPQRSPRAKEHTVPPEAYAGSRGRHTHRGTPGYTVDTQVRGVGKLSDPHRVARTMPVQETVAGRKMFTRRAHTWRGLPAPSHLRARHRAPPPSCQAQNPGGA